MALEQLFVLLPARNRAASDGLSWIHLQSPTLRKTREGLGHPPKVVTFEVDSPGPELVTNLHYRKGGHPPAGR